MKTLEYLLTLIAAINMILFYVIGGFLAILTYVLSILSSYSYFGIIGAIVTAVFVPFAQLALFIYLWWAEGFFQTYTYAFIGTIIVNNGCIMTIVLIDMLKDSIRNRIARRESHPSITH